jgi:hypothetical protein
MYRPQTPLTQTIANASRDAGYCPRSNLDHFRTEEDRRAAIDRMRPA